VGGAGEICDDWNSRAARDGTVCGRGVEIICGLLVLVGLRTSPRRDSAAGGDLHGDRHY